MMRKLLDNTQNADSFVDDLLTYTQAWDKHMEVLREVFSRISKTNLTFIPTKCKLGYTDLEFVGHTVSRGVLKPETDKIEPRHTTKTQVKSFLGLVGYYRDYIPHFASIAVPLTDLLRKGQPTKVDWGEAQQKAFASLKHSLTDSPILHVPDMLYLLLLASCERLQNIIYSRPVPKSK